ncbi:MAG: hypothetical protein IID44_11205 [Planctomycetes bacterium]|nr:hypothetical protein [Planctomycetota bacterium]
MDATKLQAYLGIPMPSIETFEEPEDQDKSRKVLYDALDDLCACSQHLEFHLGADIVKPDITLLDDAAKTTIVERRIFPKKHLKVCEILVLSSAVPLSHYAATFEPGPNDFDTRDAARCLARVEFCKRVSDLLVMSNVGRVGSVELRHSVILQDDETLSYCEIPDMVGYSLQRAAEMAERMGWPQLDVLDIKTVWNWTVKHREMLEGFDGSATGRALNAFSRLFDRKTAEQPMQLLWALVGLEALYVEGKTELLQQVREKSQVLLGRQTEYKKSVSQMYNFRSRFVHGDLDFPGLCFIHDARDEVAKYDGDLLNAIAVAVAVLAGTLQQIIRRDWSGVKFEYRVDDLCSGAS